MIVKILEECGREQALLGLSLSYNKNPSEVEEISLKLAHKDGGHNKFLESIVLWVDITAPRYWWQQFDTYRVGVTKQSQSTMHTLLKTPISQDLFESKISQNIISRLEYLRTKPDFEQLKLELPEGFLQRRIICTNYKALRNIISQRKQHKIKEWQYFINEILNNIKHKEYLPLG